MCHRVDSAVWPMFELFAQVGGDIQIFQMQSIRNKHPARASKALSQRINQRLIILKCGGNLPAQRSDVRLGTLLAQPFTARNPFDIRPSVMLCITGYRAQRSRRLCRFILRAFFSFPDNIRGELCCVSRDAACYFRMAWRHCVVSEGFV